MICFPNFKTKVPTSFIFSVIIFCEPLRNLWELHQNDDILLEFTDHFANEILDNKNTNLFTIEYFSIENLFACISFVHYLI